MAMKDRMSQSSLYTVAIIFSLLATLLSCYTNDFNINRDGILYLRTADTFIENGFTAAMAIYYWPFYSVLIGLLTQVTGLSTTSSALILNALLQIITVVYFVRCIASLGSSLRCQWFALLVIMCFPPFNEYRHYIIRDFGLWAFYLVGLYYALMFVKTHKIHHAIFCSMAFYLSALFRIEGLLFIVFFPWLLFFHPELRFGKKLQCFLQANLITLSGIVMVVIVLWSQNQLSLLDSGRIGEMQYLLSSGIELIQNSFNRAISALRDHGLSEPAMSNAGLIIFTGFIGMYVVKMIGSLTGTYSILVSISMFKRMLAGTSMQKIILFGFVLANIGMTGFFTALYFFISSRYLMPFVFTAMLWIPFLIEAVYCACLQYSRPAWMKRWLNPVLVAGFAILFIDGAVGMGASKDYVRETSQWLVENTPTSSKLYTNLPQLLYLVKGNIPSWDHYTDKAGAPILSHSWQEYDYLALKIKHNQRQQEQQIKSIIGHEPIKEIANKRGDKFIIFNCNQEGDALSPL